MTVSGGGAVGVFQVNGTATLSGLTVSGGASGYGGGILNEGSLTLTGAVIANNSATQFYYNGGYGGGVANYGSLAVANSTLSNNGAYSWGGGIANCGPLTISASTLADNSTAGGNPTGGAILNSGTLNISNSTVAENDGCGIDDYGTLMSVNNTIAYNHGDSAGGLYIATGGLAILDNTIVALNINGEGAIGDIAGSPVSSASADNLIGVNKTGSLTNGTSGNLVGVANPGLGSLAYHGGPTQTIALLPGSPAIDAGSNALAVDPGAGLPLITDQSGFARIVNGTVNIGAFEVQPEIITTTAIAVTASSLTSVYGQPVTLTATVVPQAPSRATPTGTVQFVVNGADVGAPLTLVNTGEATLTGMATLALPSLDPAAYAVTTIYTSDSADFIGSTAALPDDIIVSPAATSTTVAVSSSPTVYSQPVTFTATVMAQASEHGHADRIRPVRRRWLRRGYTADARRHGRGHPHARFAGPGRATRSRWFTQATPPISREVRGHSTGVRRSISGRQRQ